MAYSMTSIGTPISLFKSEQTAINVTRSKEQQSKVIFEEQIPFLDT